MKPFSMVSTATALILAAQVSWLCSTVRPARTQEASWDQVVAAGKAEGQLTVYNATTLTVPRLVTKKFEEKYGIRVNALEGRPSEQRERIRVELASGQAIGDVHLASSTIVVPAYVGLFQKHGPLPNIPKLKPGFKNDDYYIPAGVSRFVILINTDIIKPQDEPKSWYDLLDPKWTGKILSDDPRGASGASIAYDVWYEKFGRGFLEKVATQRPMFTSDVRLAAQRVARGEYPIFIPLSLPNYADLKGLPVKAIIPSEGSPYVDTGPLMMRNAPHPNAAKLYLNFFMEDEAQKIYADYGYQSPTGTTSDTLPAEVKAILAGKLLGASDPLRLDDMRKIFTEIYK
jgi:iron(III) transport system substrate-binding protein